MGLMGRFVPSIKKNRRTVPRSSLNKSGNTKEVKPKKAENVATECLVEMRFKKWCKEFGRGQISMSNFLYMNLNKTYRKTHGITQNVLDRWWQSKGFGAEFPFFDKQAKELWVHHLDALKKFC